MSVKPGDAVSVVFSTHDVATGSVTAADATPSGVIYQNGTGDGNVTVTVEAVAGRPGRYTASFTVPSDYAAGDDVQLLVEATVNSISAEAVIWSVTLDTYRLADISAIIWAYATRTLTANVNNVTIVSAVSGNTITVYEHDTWLFTVTDSSLAMTDYENLAFSVKTSPDDTDANAILLADITTGLVRIGQAAATNANLATVTKNSATSFTVQVEMSEVATKIASSYRGSYNWWLKGIDTTDTPDQGFTLITGTFIISGGGARQIL